MKIIHQRKKCVGCGVCAVLCPDFWKMGEDGRATLVHPKTIYNKKTKEYELDIKELGCNVEVADSCPVHCIKIIKTQ